MFLDEVFDFLLTVCAAEEFLDLDLALELHQAVEHGFGTGRATGDIYIHRYDAVNAIEHTVAFLEGSARDSATAASDNVFGLCELLPKAPQCGSHAVHDSALHHNIVGLTRGVAGNFKTEASHIVLGGTKAHELDSAAARAETEGPQGVGAAPVDELVENAYGNVGAGSVELIDKLFDVFVVFEFIEGDVFYLYILYIHFNAPFRQA